MYNNDYEYDINADSHHHCKYKTYRFQSNLSQCFEITCNTNDLISVHTFAAYLTYNH